MKIYWIKAQAPRRVLAVAKQLGLEVEFVHQDLGAGDLQSEDYAALNPNRKAPTLVDGETVLWEASAINAYLSIKAGSDLWPAADPAGQVEVLRWLSWADTHWSPAVAYFYFEYIVKATFGTGDPDLETLAGKDEAVKRFGKVLDDHLEGRTHPALDRLTIADFQLASMAADWRECHLPLGGFRNVVRWLDRLDELPAWREPWPEA